MSKQEKIVCAALKTTGTDGVCERVLISVGVDYNFIQDQEGYEHFYDTETVLKEVRGFITNKNRFVDPVEAMKIAVEAEQLEGFNNANYWDGFCSGRGDIETERKDLSDEYLERGLKPEDLY